MQTTDIVSLKKIGDVKALLERVIADTLALENSTRRSRVLISAALAAIPVLEAEEAEKSRQQINVAKARFRLG